MIYYISSYGFNISEILEPQFQIQCFVSATKFFQLFYCDVLKLIIIFKIYSNLYPSDIYSIILSYLNLFLASSKCFVKLQNSPKCSMWLCIEFCVYLYINADKTQKHNINLRILGGSRRLNELSFVNACSMS